MQEPYCTHSQDTVVCIFPLSWHLTDGGHGSFGTRDAALGCSLARDAGLARAFGARSLGVTPSALARSLAPSAFGALPLKEFPIVRAVGYS